MSSAAAKLVTLAQSSDPKQAMLKAVGDLSNVHLFSGRVLIGIYVAPEKTLGGIIRPTTNLKEDIYQGVVGLVLKKGATAFKDDGETKFYGQDIAVGDWVTFRPGDGKRIQINDVDCRVIEDTLIDMVVTDPSIVTHSR